jgi:hypothetical protein
MASGHKIPLPREPGFSWIASAGLIVVATALASDGSNEPPRRFGTRLGGSFVILRVRGVLNARPAETRQVIGSYRLFRVKSTSW